MSMFMDRLKRYTRLRFAVLYPFAIYIAFFTSPTDESLRWGAAFMVLGSLIRLWSNGYAIKMDRLTTSGPYAFVRNPLYCGTAIIVFGVIVLVNLAWPGVIVLVGWGLAYRRTVSQEEVMLADKFGKDYLDYKSKVPAFWPALQPFTSGEKWPFSWQRLWDSREHKVFLWLIIAIVAFNWKEEILIDKGTLTTKLAVSIAVAIVLAFLDGVTEWIRVCRKAMAV